MNNKIKKNNKLLSKKNESKITKLIDISHINILKLISKTPFLLYELSFIIKQVLNNKIKVYKVFNHISNLNKKKDKKKSKTKIFKINIFKKMNIILNEFIKIKKKYNNKKKFKKNINKIYKTFKNVRLTSNLINILHKIIYLHIKRINNIKNKIINFCVNKCNLNKIYIKNILKKYKFHHKWIKKEIQNNIKNSYFLCIYYNNIKKYHLKFLSYKKYITISNKKLNFIYKKFSHFKNTLCMVKNNLLKHNIKLIISIAKNYKNRGLNFTDLIQEGSIGLIKAINKFEYNKGYKFSTYATWWIRQSIARSISEQSKMIRIPIHMSEMINKINNIYKEIKQKTGVKPDMSILVKKMNLPKSKIKKILKVIKDPISIDKNINESNTNLIDLIENKNAISPSKLMMQKSLKFIVNKFLNLLPKKESLVLKMRFGIGKYKCHTLNKIGKKFNLSRERIRQIETSAFKYLRNKKNLNKLKKFLGNENRKNKF